MGCCGSFERGRCGYAPILSHDAALRTLPRCLGREKYRANCPRHGLEDNKLGDGCIKETI
jgi:hypothetical protein